MNKLYRHFEKKLCYKKKSAYFLKILGHFEKNKVTLRNYPATIKEVGSLRVERLVAKCFSDTKKLSHN